MLHFVLVTVLCLCSSLGLFCALVLVFVQCSIVLVLYGAVLVLCHVVLPSACAVGACANAGLKEPRDRRTRRRDADRRRQAQNRRRQMQTDVQLRVIHVSHPNTNPVKRPRGCVALSHIQSQSQTYAPFLPCCVRS